MFNSFKRPAIYLSTLVFLSLSLAAYAQNTAPSFFGSGNQSSAAPKTATAARPSTTQVWSKDDFTKKTTELNSKRETNFQNKLNSSLKPMPAKSAPISSPIPAGGTATPATTPSIPQSTPNTTATPQTQATPSSGYTGFSSPPPANKSPSQTNSSSGGWNVTY